MYKPGDLIEEIATGKRGTVFGPADDGRFLVQMHGIGRRKFRPEEMRKLEITWRKSG